MASDLEALKHRLKTTWMAGDYAYFATYLEPGALAFLGRLEARPGTRMLDVACGAGQIAIPAARAGVKVTGIDIAANAIETARFRAKAEGLDAWFEEGDAEDIACEDASFDLVVSLIGAMFAPRPERVASELVRVCRPGGRIAMANWTPGGFVGQMFKIVGTHVPPPPDLPSPVKWGDEGTVRDRLGKGIAKLETQRHLYPMHYPFPPATVVDFFRAYYGPINRAFTALDADGQRALHQDLERLWTFHNHAKDGATTQVEAEYLEVMAERAG
jgi:SAM-dependent methyltransferase